MKNQFGYFPEEEQSFERITMEHPLRPLNDESKSWHTSTKNSVEHAASPVFPHLNAPIYKDMAQICALASKVFKTHKVMIAGGAVRDTLLGRKVKDIDVFIEYSGNLDRSEIDSFARMAGSKTPIKLSEFYYGQMVHLADVYDTIWNKPIQLVFVKNLVNHFNNFTINLSKVKFTSDGLMLSHEFIDDVKNRQITINVKNLHEYEEKYIVRVAAKYPDFKVVNG